MKHPTQEQWMEFLYGELPRLEKKEIARHLQECSPCSAQYAEYRDTFAKLGGHSSGGARQQANVIAWPQAAKWAAAAALLVTTGFTTARFATPPLRPEVIEAQIAGPLREKLSRELEARLTRDSEIANERLQQIAEHAAEAAMAERQFATALGALKERDATLYSAFHQMEQKYQGLREDIERVALYTDRGMRSTERQLIELASMNQNVTE